jgi:hypothetical protein
MVYNDTIYYCLIIFPLSHSSKSLGSMLFRQSAIQWNFPESRQQEGQPSAAQRDQVRFYSELGKVGTVVMNIREKWRWIRLTCDFRFQINGDWDSILIAADDVDKISEGGPPRTLFRRVECSEHRDDITVNFCVKLASFPDYRPGALDSSLVLHAPACAERFVFSGTNCLWSLLIGSCT